jgi:hypothetical protein
MIFISSAQNPLVVFSSVPCAPEVRTSEVWMTAQSHRKVDHYQKLFEPPPPGSDLRSLLSNRLQNPRSKFDGGCVGSEDVTVPAEPSDAERMPPPPTSRILWPSVPGDSEPIPHKRAYGFIKDFVFAFGLWCIQTNLTRQQYSNLLEVLKLLTDMSDIQRLPMSIETLKKCCMHDATSQTLSPSLYS